MINSILFMAIPDFSSVEVWVSLLTLTFLEVVLGVDNIIFISISANKVEESKQARARNIGLLLAMLFRVILIFGISYLIAMQSAWFSIDWKWFHAAFSGQSLILIAGGIFLLYKSTSEIHHKLEGQEHNEGHEKGSKIKTSMSKVIVQITLINVVFSFDSILTAVGLTDNIMIMIIAVVLSMIIMMVFMGPVGRYVNDHPTIQMLGLSFLILIGFMLIAEGAHLAHLSVLHQEIGAIPKGYLYFAIAFSLGVELLNIRLRKRKKPVQLRGAGEEAVEDGII